MLHGVIGPPEHERQEAQIATDGPVEGVRADDDAHASAQLVRQPRQQLGRGVDVAEDLSGLGQPHEAVATEEPR